MNKTRLVSLIIGAALIVIAILSVQTYEPAASAKNSGASNAGMGDLHRSEALNNGAPIVGMGDLHLLEAKSGGPAYTGMGDWRRFEVEQASATSYVGFGDLQRYNAYGLVNTR